MSWTYHNIHQVYKGECNTEHNMPCPIHISIHTTGSSHKIGSHIDKTTNENRKFPRHLAPMVFLKKVYAQYMSDG